MMETLSDFFTSLFFAPDKGETGDPGEAGIAYEKVIFPSEEGGALTGYFMKPDGQPRGTVVHCHGNSGSIASQHPYAHAFIRLGYNALTFDYRGYGESAGKPTPKGIIEDALDAVNYAKNRPDVDPARIALFGQSLGAAAAAGAMARNASVRALILEGAFTTYRDMAWTTKRGRFLFFLTNKVIPDLGPLRDLDQIGDRPLLLIHGEKDNLIPARFSRLLYEAAPTPDKTLSLFSELRHLNGAEELPEYESVLRSFLKKSLK